jgi:hypothetical protein
MEGTHVEQQVYIKRDSPKQPMTVKLRGRANLEDNVHFAVDLHHLYRAMAWLGEELPEKEQDGRTPFSPRCGKDVVEENWFLLM